MDVSLLSILLSLLPILWLFLALGIFRMSAVSAGSIGLILAAAGALLFPGMTVSRVAFAAVEGAVLALWPILWAIVGAVFAYNVGVSTGYVSRIRNMLSGVSTDRRVQVLILAWAFSGFLEGATGYGTAVAIPLGILIALGFEPVSASVICLIGNTAPTAFGAIGIPAITLAKLTDYGIMEISSDIALQLTPFIVVLPFVMVLYAARTAAPAAGGSGSMSGGTAELKAGKDRLGAAGSLKGALGVTLVAGISFAVVNYFSARYIGPELPALLGGIVSLGAILLWVHLFHREWEYRERTLLDEEAAAAGSVSGGAGVRGTGKLSGKASREHLENFRAWAPYVILFFLIIFTSSIFPRVNETLDRLRTDLRIFPGPDGTVMTIHWLLTPGSLMFFAAVSGGLLQGASVGELIQVFGRTLLQLRKSIYAIIAIVALAKVMTYSGMTSVLAAALAGAAGRLYPLFAPLVGAIGTFLTGSDTSSNVLFASLQKQTAQGIGLDPRWISAANTAGATAGKMISPQNIAIAAATAGLLGREGDIFRKALPVCAAYVAVLGVFILITSFL